MAECSSVENASEDVFDFVCGPCNVDGEVLQAKGYCSDCQDYLCDLCFKTHIRPKPLRHHVLLDEKAMPKNKKATTANKTSDICTERCEKHSGNVIEYYCQRHDFVGCTKCFISDNHRKCEGVICIEDTAHGIFHSQEFTNFERTVEQLSNILSESSSVQQQNDENIKICSIRANQDIKNFRANMNEYLDRLENEMNNEVSQMKDRQTSKLMSTSKQIGNLETNMKAIQGTIERTRNLGQKSNLYIYMKRNSDKLKLLEDRIETVKKDGGVSEYMFTPDGNLLGQKAKTFGKLVIKETAKPAEGSDVRTLPTVGLYTVLLLDTSSSMAGQPFNDLKTFVNTMITDIDTFAVTHGLEEHIAIVTCGEGPTIAQHFTNDYQQIRTVVDGLQIKGRSPLISSLVLSLCYLELQGQKEEIEGHLVPPRLIIISDFEAASDIKFQGQDTDSSQVQTNIVKLSDVLKSRSYPIFCVPIGRSNNDVSHQLAENSGGEVITVDNPVVAGNYYRHQTVVGSVLQQYNLSMEQERDEDIGTLIIQVLSQAGLSQDHKGDVERLLEKALMADTSGMDDHDLMEDEDMTSKSPPSGAGGGRGRGHNRRKNALCTHEATQSAVDDDLSEWTYERQLVQLSLEEKGRLPELGTRVKRGADWKWGNEDGNGSGTIVGHKDNGCVYMVWDNMKMGLYRYGLENAYDLDKDLTPRYVRLGDIEIGCWVIRGPDWSYYDEDGGVGTVGVVVRKLPDRYVQVRWPSRVFRQYKFGADNKWDLEITLEPPHSAGVPVYTGLAGQNNRGTGQTAGGAYNTEETQGHQDGETFVPEKYEINWKWEDSNKQRRIFSEEAIKIIENGYQTLKGKVFVQSNGKNIKVYIDCREGKMECEFDGKRRPIMREVLL